MTAILVAISLFGSGIALVMGVLALLRNPHQRLNQIFMLVCLNAAGMAFFDSQIRQATEFSVSHIWVHLWAFWPLEAAFVLHFILIFSGYQRFLKHKYAYVLIYAPPLLASLFGLYHPAGGEPVRVAGGWRYGLVNSPADVLIVMWPIAEGLIVLFVAIRNYLRVRGTRDSRLAGYVLAGISVPVLAGIGYGTIFSYIQYPLSEINSLAFAFGAGGIIGIAMWKYGMFNLNPAGAADKILETMSDGLLLVDAGGRITSSNRAACDLLGENAQSLRGADFYSYLPDEAMRAERRQFIADQSARGAHAIETELAGSDGKRVPVTLSCSKLLDHSGQFCGTVCVASDISRQQQRERQLRESETRYRTLFDMSPDGIMLLDLKGTILMCNKQIYKKHGFEREDQIVGRNGAEFMNPEDSRRMMSDLKGVLDRRDLEEGPIAEYRLAGAAGGYWPAEIKGSVIRGGSGAPAGFMLILRDVTDQKNAERALRESEARYRTLFETSPDGVGVTDLSGRVIICNEILPKLFGFDRPEAMIGRLNTDFVMPGERRRVAASSREIIEKGLKSSEYTGLRRDGSQISIEVSVSPMFNPEGKPEAFLFVLRDISDRKARELVLRESEQRFRKIFEEGPLGMAFVDLDLKFARVNATLCELVGYPEAELVGRRFADITHPDDVKKDVESGRRLRDGEISSYRTEKRYIKKHGGLVWIGLTVSRINDESGKTLYFLGMMEDISERKAFEEKILAQSRQLQSANDELTAYNRISTVISQNIEMDELLGDVLSALTGMDMLNIERRGGILLLEGERLRLVSHLGHDREFLDAHQNLTLDSCLCGLAARTGETIFTSSSLDDERHMIRYPGMKDHGHVILPLKSADSVIGVMYLYLPAGADMPDNRLALLETVASQLSIAIANSQLFEKTKTLSLHDPLTGLANRNLMGIELTKSFARSKRTGEPLSVVMIDLDWFKNYNDTYGHAAGDRLLIEIAAIILGSIRDVDLAVRYGGEEFLVILPDTGTGAAGEVSERIRRKVDMADFYPVDKGPAAHISISLGVASISKKISDPDLLVARADSCLYRAKSLGRNRVEIWAQDAA